MTRYPCLFTNRIKQKTKLFKDGFIDVAQERNGYKYLLLDENLSIIVSMKSPEKPLLNGDDFLVGGFLVQIFSGKKNHLSPSKETRYRHLPQAANRRLLPAPLASQISAMSCLYRPVAAQSRQSTASGRHVTHRLGPTVPVVHQLDSVASSPNRQNRKT